MDPASRLWFKWLFPTLSISALVLVRFFLHLTLENAIILLGKQDSPDMVPYLVPIRWVTRSWWDVGRKLTAAVRTTHSRKQSWAEQGLTLAFKFLEGQDCVLILSECHGPNNASPPQSICWNEILINKAWLNTTVGVILILSFEKHVWTALSKNMNVTA